MVGIYFGSKEGEQTEGISCAKALWLETSVAGAKRARDRMVGGEAMCQRGTAYAEPTGRLRGFVFILSSRGRK